MKIKIQYYKRDTDGEYKPIKEGTEVSTKKEAKPIIDKLFQLFSLKPEASIEINNDKFVWNDFESKMVNHIVDDTIETLTFKEAKKIAMRVKK